MDATFRFIITIKQLSGVQGLNHIHETLIYYLNTPREKSCMRQSYEIHVSLACGVPHAQEILDTNFTIICFSIFKQESRSSEKLSPQTRKKNSFYKTKSIKEVLLKCVLLKPLQQSLVAVEPSRKYERGRGKVWLCE